MSQGCTQFDQASMYDKLSKSVQFKNRAKLLDMLKIKEGDRILDVGCGTGLMDKVLLDGVGLTGHVTGVDPDEGRLSLARNMLHGYSNVELHVSRSNNFPFHEDKPFDAVVSNMVYHWVADDEKVESFARVFASLKPGGTFAAAFSNGRSRTLQAFVDACEMKHPGFRSAYDKVRSSCIFYMSVECLEKHLYKVGFTDVCIEQVDETFGLATQHLLMDFCQVSFANTPMGQFNYRSLFEEVVEDIDFLRLSNGDFEVHIPTCFFRAEKPSSLA